MLLLQESQDPEILFAMASVGCEDFPDPSSAQNPWSRGELPEELRQTAESQAAQTLMPSAVMEKLLLVVSAGALRELIPEVPPPAPPGIVYVPTESADPYLKWVIANAVEVEEQMIAQHHGLRPQQLSESDGGGARSSRDTEVDLSNLTRELSLPTHTSTVKIQKHRAENGASVETVVTTTSVLRNRSRSRSPRGRPSIFDRLTEQLRASLNLREEFSTGTGSSQEELTGREELTEEQAHHGESWWRSRERRLGLVFTMEQAQAVVRIMCTRLEYMIRLYRSGMLYRRGTLVHHGPVVNIKQESDKAFSQIGLISMLQDCMKEVVEAEGYRAKFAAELREIERKRLDKDEFDQRLEAINVRAFKVLEAFHECRQDSWQEEFHAAALGLSWQQYMQKIAQWEQQRQQHERHRKVAKAMIASWPASREKDHMLKGLERLYVEPLQQRPPPKGPSPAGPPPPTPTLFSKASIKPQVHSTLRNEPLQQTPPPAGPPPATPGPGYKVKPIPDTDYPAWEYYRTGGRIIHPHETRLWPPSPPRPKKRGWWSITSL